MITEIRSKLAVPLLCQVLVVSTSEYYGSLERSESLRQKDKARLVIEIKAAHETYGPERLQKDLAEHGVHVGVHRSKHIRKQHCIRCN